MPIARTICAAFCLGVALLLAAPLRAQTGTAASADKTLHLGDSEVYEFDGMTTAAVGSPAVADIVPLSAHRLLVNAKGVGQTTLFVYDRRGKHRLRLAVIALTSDLGPLAAQVQSDIGLPGVIVRALKDTLLLEGTVTSAVAFQRAAAIAGVYTSNVRNLLTVTPDRAGQPLAQTYAALLTANLKETGVTVQVIDDKTIALSGEYAQAYAQERGAAQAASGEPSQSVGSPAPSPLQRLLQSLPPELKVVDLLNMASRPARQILVRAKVIDIDRVASKNLGINWGTLSSQESRAGNIYSFQPQPILFGQIFGGVSASPLGGGNLNRLSPFAAQLNLLISENKARILSEPSLMVLDGNDGSILVGGEIPIPVAQSSNGTNGVSASVTIEYKPYGVRLLVHASVVGDSAVQMTVTPEVSELDYSTGVQISGFLVPGLDVRRATSTLQMADGETLVIGGLYSNTTSRQVQRIPLLSQIPVLGEFFKNTVTRKEESELLILIQPEIVTPNTPGTRPPASGSLENLPIARPDVGRSDFDKDFPDLNPNRSDQEKPGPPVSLPPMPRAEEP